jgi:hypothetical protein
LISLRFALSAAIPLFAIQASALSVDELPKQEWRVGGIDVEGADAVSSDTITEHMLTKERAWYAPWRARPPFNPGTDDPDNGVLGVFIRVASLRPVPRNRPALDRSVLFSQLRERDLHDGGCGHGQDGTENAE